MLSTVSTVKGVTDARTCVTQQYQNPSLSLTHTLTFQPDNQGHLELQLSAGLCDAIRDDGTVHNPAKNIHQDGLHLKGEKEREMKVDKY